MAVRPLGGVEHGAHGPGGQEQPLRDLVDVQAGGRQVEDPPLAAGEPGRRVRRRPRAGARAARAPSTASRATDRAPQARAAVNADCSSATASASATSGERPSAIRARAASRAAGVPGQQLHRLPKLGACPRAPRSSPSSRSDGSERRGGSPAPQQRDLLLGEPRRPPRAARARERPRLQAAPGRPGGVGDAGPLDEGVISLERLRGPPLLEAQPGRRLGAAAARPRRPRAALRAASRLPSRAVQVALVDLDADGERRGVRRRRRPRRPTCAAARWRRPTTGGRPRAGRGATA